MSKRVQGLLMALLLLLSLSGCGTLEALKQFRDEDQTPPASDNSTAESDKASSAPETPPSEGKKFFFPDRLTPSQNPESPEIPESPVYPENVPAEPPATSGGDPALEALQDEISRSGSTGGLAFIGYVDSQSSEMELRDYIAYSDIGQERPFLQDAALLMTEGQELYAVCPPNPYGTVTVYASGVTEWGEYVDDTSTPLYTGMPGEAVIVQCNLSEIYSNVLISVTDGGGAIQFRPSLSMMDGRIVEMAGVYDFSVYAQSFDAFAVLPDTEKLT